MNALEELESALKLANDFEDIEEKEQRSAIPSFFEIKEAGGVCALSEKNRIVGF
jgi:hypothetical protein